MQREKHHPTSDLYVYDGRKKQRSVVGSAEAGFKQVECVCQDFSEPTSLFIEKLRKKKVFAAAASVCSVSEQSSLQLLWSCHCDLLGAGDLTPQSR